MTLPNFNDILPRDFSERSRVWIYQSNRPFLPSETAAIASTLSQFTNHWKSHGNTVKGFATLLLNHFIIIMADESSIQVSGCSTDSSVKLIKEIEQTYSVDLFNRTNLSFFVNGKIQVVPMIQLPTAIENGIINTDSLIFNNTILTKLELENNWIIPLKDSWLYKKLAIKL